MQSHQDNVEKKSLKKLKDNLVGVKMFGRWPKMHMKKAKRMHTATDAPKREISEAFGFKGSMQPLNNPDAFKAIVDAVK
jgi:hypothetical protein